MLLVTWLATEPSHLPYSLWSATEVKPMLSPLECAGRGEPSTRGLTSGCCTLQLCSGLDLLLQQCFSKWLPDAHATATARGWDHDVPAEWQLPALQQLLAHCCVLPDSSW